MTLPPFSVTGGDRPSRWLITCDHATNRVPSWVNGGDLGIPAEDMARHIAYDVGAQGVALALGEALEAPVICTDYSRLVIDPNRGEDDPTLLMRLYDGTVIPANRNAGQAELEERLARLYRPYHDAVADLAGRRTDTVIIAVHSFTPRLKGRAMRPWEVAILYSHKDPRLALPLIEELRRGDDLFVGVNEPYSGHLDGDSIDRHALVPGRLNALIELRNDLIESPEAQAAWGARLAPILRAALARAEVPADAV